jgi:hypothetical protein
MRRTISATILLALILAPAQIAAAAPDQEPLRSGTIEGGTGVITGGGPPWENPAVQRSGCQYALDCLAWVQSDCDPALAGHNPALTASIVAVGNLADGRTRRSFRTVGPPIPPLWPGAVVQLWRQNCTEILHAKRHTNSSCESGVSTRTRCKAFRIPTGARWMTVSGNATTVHLSWALT